MNDETLNRLTSALERIADAQEAQVALLRELQDIEIRKAQLADTELELKGLIRSYRTMMRNLPTSQEQAP